MQIKLENLEKEGKLEVEYCDYADNGKFNI